jgi:hypothetical protein
LLEWYCHAVGVAIRHPETEAGGLGLLETVLDRADANPISPLTPNADAGLKSNGPWLAAALRIDGHINWANLSVSV